MVTYYLPLYRLVTAVAAFWKGTQRERPCCWHTRSENYTLNVKTVLMTSQWHCCCPVLSFSSSDVLSKFKPKRSDMVCLKWLLSLGVGICQRFTPFKALRHQFLKQLLYGAHTFNRREVIPVKIEGQCITSLQSSSHEFNETANP